MNRTTSASTLTVGSLTNDLIFDVLDGYRSSSPAPTLTPGASQTTIASQTGGTFEAYKISTKPGPSSSLSWTSNADALIHIAMNIRSIPAPSTDTVVSRTFTGADQTFVVPAGVTSINVKLWGGGGAQTGGGGAFVSGALAVTPGETLTIITGGGGSLSPVNGASPSVYGGGGLGYGDGSSILGGAGGGRSAIRRGSTELVTAGAGGGGNSNAASTNGTALGGAGGLTTGGNALHPLNNSGSGSGGTQSAGGAKGGTSTTSTNGSQFAGGIGHNGGPTPGGGGGGSGYYGGGGGADNSILGGGGGGSSLTSGLTNFAGEEGVLGSRFGAVPGGTAHEEYVAGVGRGGAINATGGNGLVVISYTASANTAPTVTTATQSDVTATSATLGGNVTADGGATVTERGIVWGTSTGPTTANNKVQNGSGTGAFSGTVNSLPANTTIYVRAYAINSVNTSYGSEISFATLPPTPTSSISVSPVNVVEDGAPNLVYTVTLNPAPLSNVSVAYTVGGTATNGTDYATISSPLVITAGNTTGTITVNPTADATIETNETVILTLASGSGYTVGAPDSATGTILNDDLPFLTINDVTANEGNSGTTNFTFTVSLSAPAAPTVTLVTPATGPAAGGTSVTITGTNFSAPVGVSFGGLVASNVVVVNATTITATTPPGTAGTASVLVTTAGGTNAANTLFTYTAPATVLSLNGTSNGPQNGDFISWQVIFDVPVSGLTASNFATVPTGLGGSPAVVSVNPPGSSPSTTWNISVSTGTGDGTLGVNLVNDTGLSHDVTNVPFTGIVRTIDKTAPTIGIGSPSVSTIAAGAGSVTYTVTYADTNFSASTLSAGNITLNSTGTANGSVAVSGSGLTRTVTISSISGVGSLGISIATGTASDTAGNTAPAAGPSATFDVTATTNTEIASTGTVLDASNNLPAGGSLGRVFPGVINEDGYISFKALGTAGTGGFTTGNTALMITNHPAGTLSVLGQQGMLLPDGGALKGTFDNLVLTNAGRSISFDQFSGTTTSKDSGYLIAEGAATAELLSREGDTPTGGGTFTGHTGRHAADDEERVYFIGALSGVATTRNGGVWYDDAGSLEILIKKGDDVGTLTGDLSWLGNIAAPISAGGDGAAFIAALQNNPANATQRTPVALNAGVFSGAPGNLELVARKGDVIPAVGTLTSFSGVSRGGNGDHAFISLLAASTTAPVVSTTNDQVLMAEINGVKHLVARENTTPIIASLSPTRFGNFYMTSTGAVIYQAWLTGAGVTTTNDSVLCRWTVAGGNEVLAREGDTAPGTTLKYGSFQVFSVSPGGAIALQGTLSSGGFIMRALPGAGFGLVVRTQTNVLVNGTNLKIASLSIHDSGAGTGGGGGGLGSAINDDGAIFTVLTTLDAKYVTRIFEP